MGFNFKVAQRKVVSSFHCGSGADTGKGVDGDDDEGERGRRGLMPEATSLAKPNSTQTARTNNSA